MFSDMFSDFREEFLQILTERNQKIASLESDAVSLKKTSCKTRRKKLIKMMLTKDVTLWYYLAPVFPPQIIWKVAPS